MKNNLSCELVLDLLPLCADHLTAPETEKQVQAHLAECESCRKVYAQMTAAEPTVQKESRKVDVFKKIKKGRLRLIVCTLLAAALIVTGSFGYFKASADRATVTYDTLTRTVVVCGTSDYADLKFTDELKSAANLEVQDDSFHLSIYLPVLKTDRGHIQSFLPDYLDRTDKSLDFLRAYLNEHAPDSYCAEQADKYVDLTISKTSGNDYGYANEEDRIRIELGSFYWHREELFLFSLMDGVDIEWAQLGYAWYLSSIDPFSDLADGMGDLKYEPYYQTYVKAGGNPEPKTTEDLLLICHAVSHECLTKGMGWGTAYESWSLSRTAFFTGDPDREGNGMSVTMATSMIDWLCQNHGFDRVSAYCFGQMSFEEAFGCGFDSAFQSWSEWILSTYGA